MSLLLIKRLLTSVSILTVMSCVAASQAATIYDESASGDLTGFIEVSPWITPGTSVGTLSVGANTVIGEFGTLGPNDTDVFTFEIPAGHQLDSIDLTYSVISGSPGGGSYLAIQGGTDLGTGMSTAGNNLSNALVAASGELLAVFEAGPAYGGTGLTTPLPAGPYTLGLSEIGAAIGYSMAFNVSSVPEPRSAALVLFLLTIAVLLSHRTKLV